MRGSGRGRRGAQHLASALVKLSTRRGASPPQIISSSASNPSPSLPLTDSLFLGPQVGDRRSFEEINSVVCCLVCYGGMIRPVN